MRKKLTCGWTLALCLWLSGLSYGQAADADFVPPQATEAPTEAQTRVAGIILEKGSRKPMSRITFFIKETGGSVTTDKAGRFEFALSPGKYTAVFPVLGYQPLEKTFKAALGDANWLEIRLAPEVFNPYQITARARKKKTEVSARAIDIQEAVATPGTNRDVIQSVTNLPGVNTVSVFNGYGSGLIIRGSSWEDSVYHVNDHWIPMLYHFGGFESIFEPELVDSIDYYAGGFSPEFGEALGGVVKVNIRDPRQDRFGGYVNTSLLSSSCMIEGPLSENSAAAVSLKRGFLDLYTRAISSEFEDELSFTTYPQYYDGSFLYTYNPSQQNRLRLIGIGAADKMALILSDADVSARYDNTLNAEIRFINVIGEWEFRRGNFKSTFSPMLGYHDFTYDQGSRFFFKTSEYEFSLSEKAEYRLSETQRLQAGFRLSSGVFKIDSSLMAPQKEGEVDHNPYSTEINDSQRVNYHYPSLYVMDILEIGKLTLAPGIRVLYDSHNDRASFDPRLTARYQLTDQLTLKSAGGYYSKMPEADECYEPWGTKGLKSERALHGVLGLERQMTQAISLDVQGYYKDFEQLVVRVAADDPTVYDNQGQGYAYGGELMLRHQLTDRFFGWLAYSYCVSKRQDTPDKAERYFDLDITHNLTVVASYKPSRYWQFGARFTYISGLPYTDLSGVETGYDVDNDEYTPVYSGPINDQRMKPRHQLDIRIDKYWLFNNWILSTYLDIQNVYLRKNELGYTYNTDYTERAAFSGLPVMVFLGLKADF